MCVHSVLCSDLRVARSEPVLPLLSFVQKKGNTTSYEWRTGNPPVVVEKPVMEEAPADTVTEETVSLHPSSPHSILGEPVASHLHFSFFFGVAQEAKTEIFEMTTY